MTHGISDEIFQKLYINPPQSDDLAMWNERHWLNTPGPVFTGHTDNCGTGQPAAMNFVTGDYEYHEAVFRQPKSEADLLTIQDAAQQDPFQAYSFMGAKFWTVTLIKEWWSCIEAISSHVVAMRDKELAYGPGDPHLSTWNLRGEIREMHLFGPATAIPQNYQNWLDYYESGDLEKDVSVFAYFLDNKKLPDLDAVLPDFKHVPQRSFEITRHHSIWTVHGGSL